MLVSKMQLQCWFPHFFFLCFVMSFVTFHCFLIVYVCLMASKTTIWTGVVFSVSISRITDKKQDIKKQKSIWKYCNFIWIVRGFLVDNDICRQGSRLFPHVLVTSKCLKGKRFISAYSFEGSLIKTGLSRVVARESRGEPGSFLLSYLCGAFPTEGPSLATCPALKTSP